MTESNISELIKSIDDIETIPDTRSYWLVRTQGGSLYDKFIESGYVAIEHERISLFMLSDLRKTNPDDKSFQKELKERVLALYPEEERPGLIANQIIKFVYDLKKNDIVVIPSQNSHKVSFGIVTDSKIPELSASQMAATGFDYKKRKHVKWLKEIDKDDLDLQLYKMLSPHMAITDVTFYSQEIERALSTFFVKNNEGNLVLNVNTTDDIGAYELFQTGYYILEVAKDFYSRQGIELDLKSIDLKINLNSPGKIHLKAPKASTVWLIGVLIVGIAGGGIDVKSIGLHLGTDGLIKKVNEYANDSHDRAMKDTLMVNIKHLKMENPDDAVKLLQQMSTNKNLPK